MITVNDKDRISWRKEITIVDLLQNFKDRRPLVGAVISGRYVSRSQFSRIKIPDGAKVQLIPWHEGMTLSDLLNYEIDEQYFSAATVGRRLIPEAHFGATLIPKDAEVWLLPPVGGG